MTSFIPASPTLADIKAGDIVNWAGNTGVVDSVSNVVLDAGRISVDVVLDDADDVDHTITLTNADTILSSYHIDAGGNSLATWSQTADA